MANIPNNRWGPRKWKWTLWTRTLSSGSLDLESVKKASLTNYRFSRRRYGFETETSDCFRNSFVNHQIRRSIHAITDEADIYLKDSRKGTRR